MKVTTEKGQLYEIDFNGRRLRSFNQKGETDGWEAYQECGIPGVGDLVRVTLEPGLELTIDRVKQIDGVTASDLEFLEKLAGSLKNTNGGC